MATIEVKTIDREAILHLVDGLEGFEKDRAIRAGLAAAAGVFKAKGRSNLRNWMRQHGHPNGVRGNLLKSFKNRVKKSRPGVLAGFEWPKGNHAHLVDQGTVLRQTKTHDTGIMPASHFWEDTKNSEESKAMQKLYAGIEKAVQRIQERRK